MSGQWPGTSPAVFSGRCWNCGGYGHRFSRCPSPKRDFCPRCGANLAGDRCPRCVAPGPLSALMDLRDPNPRDPPCPDTPFRIPEDPNPVPCPRCALSQNSRFSPALLVTPGMVMPRPALPALMGQPIAAPPKVISGIGRWRLPKSLEQPSTTPDPRPQTPKPAASLASLPRPPLPLTKPYCFLPDPSPSQRRTPKRDGPPPPPKQDGRRDKYPDEPFPGVFAPSQSPLFPPPPLPLPAPPFPYAPIPRQTKLPSHSFLPEPGQPYLPRPSVPPGNPVALDARKVTDRVDLR